MSEYVWISGSFVVQNLQMVLTMTEYFEYHRVSAPLVLLLSTACHTTVGSHCHLVTVCVISHHRSGNVFVQQSSVFVWQWLSCTVILSRVQTRQVQGHHAAGIVSGDVHESLDTLSIDGATSIIRYNPHPLHCFPRRLPGPVHVVASKSKPRSFTGETETFTRLLQHCTGGNGLQALTFHPWWIQRGRKLPNQFSSTNLTLTVYTGEYQYQWECVLHPVGVDGNSAAAHSPAAPLKYWMDSQHWVCIIMSGRRESWRRLQCH